MKRKLIKLNSKLKLGPPEGSKIIYNYFWSSTPLNSNENHLFLFDSGHLAQDYIEISELKFEKQHFTKHLKANKKIYLTPMQIENVSSYYEVRDRREDALTLRQFKFKSIFDGTLYLTNDKNLDNNNLSIGDYRVSYYEIEDENYISILGAKKGDEIVPKDFIEGTSSQNIMFVKNQKLNWKGFMRALKQDMKKTYFNGNVFAFIVFVFGICLHFFNEKKNK